MSLLGLNPDKYMIVYKAANGVFENIEQFCEHIKNCFKVITDNNDCIVRLIIKFKRRGNDYG